MNDVKEIVLNYLLNSRSKVGLLISGKWGVGKTFYFRNELVPIIEKQTNKKVLYVSLNGVNSINEIYNQLISEKYLTLKKAKGSKLGRFTLGAFKSILEIGLKKGLDISSEDIKMNIHDLANFTKNIICFDDLERVGDSIKIPEILGFINTTFIEHEKIKVIFIGDETKDKLKEKGYIDSKEKVIGWTVSFKPVFSDTVKSIIESYKDEKNFYDWIKNYTGFIIECLEYFEFDNLRSLEFFFDCISKIYKIKEKRYELIDTEILYFTLIMCNEYKEGNLLYYKSIDNLPDFVSQKEKRYLIQPNSETEQGVFTKDYFHKFIFNGLMESHNYEFKYIFFENIYKYIIDGNIFEECLFEELEKIFEQKKIEKDSKYIELVKELRGFYYITNEKFDEIFSELVDAIKNDRLNLFEFVSASTILLTISKKSILELNEEELMELLIEKAKKIESKPSLIFKRIKPYHTERLISDLSKESTELANIIESKFKVIFDTIYYEEVQIDFNNWEVGTVDENKFRDIIYYIETEKIVNKIIENFHDRNFLDHFCIRMEKSYKLKSLLKHFSSHREKLVDFLEQFEVDIRGMKLKKIDKLWANTISHFTNIAINNFSEEEE